MNGNARSLQHRCKEFAEIVARRAGFYSREKGQGV
jgi:hypothetical protein